MTYQNTCKRCGKTYESGRNIAGYCSECRIERQKERNKKYMERKRKGDTRSIGSPDICANCGKAYVVKSGSQILCDECVKNGVKLTKSKVNTKYRDKTYDSITVYVSKGNKEKIKDYALKKDFKSVNDFVNQLIEYAMARNVSKKDLFAASVKDDSLNNN